jgi:hypothetical protein
VIHSEGIPDGVTVGVGDGVGTIDSEQKIQSAPI